MKKLIVSLSLALVGACHSAPRSMVPAPVLSGNQTGAADPQDAVRGFMTAVKNQDLQMISAFWGSAEGPARELGAPGDLQKREIIMTCYLKHDRYDIIGDAPNTRGGRTFVVSVTYKELTRTTNFQLVQGPGGRWYVENIDVQKLNDICAHKG